MIILYTFSQDKLDADLAKLMMQKVQTYHCADTAELVFEPVRGHGEATWHIREPNKEPPRGMIAELQVSSCRSMIEGLYQGWMLATKPARDKALANALKRKQRKEQNNEVR